MRRLRSRSDGATRIDSVRGIWSTIADLAISIVVLIAANRSPLAGNLTRAINSGTNASLLPIFNTARLEALGP